MKKMVVVSVLAFLVLGSLGLFFAITTKGGVEENDRKLAGLGQEFLEQRMLRAQLETLQNELQREGTEKARLQEKLGAKEELAQGLRERVELLETEKDALGREESRLKQETASLQAELQNSAGRIVDLEERLREEKAALAVIEQRLEAENTEGERVRADLQEKLQERHETIRELEASLDEVRRKREVLGEQHERLLNYIVRLSRMTGGLPGKRVVPVYFHPKGIHPRGKSIEDIERALAQVQGWYAEQLEGATFVRGNVMVLEGRKTLLEYREEDDPMGTIVTEVLERTAMIHRHNSSSIVLGFLESTGGLAGGNWGWAFVGDVALDGIAGSHETYGTPLPDWMKGADNQMGAIAHELGHAFGLPHSPEEGSVMLNWWDFPKVGLTFLEREYLIRLLSR